MINWWHLLWVVPLACIFGVAVEAMMIVSNDEDDENDDTGRT